MIELLAPNEPFTYKSETFGYRLSEPVLWQDSVWFFGCSHVWGVGVDRDQTTPYQLSSLIDKPVLNLGVPRASPQMVEYNLRRLLDHYVPPLIIIAWPTLERWLSWTDAGQPLQWTAMHFRNNIDPKERERSMRDFNTYSKLVRRGEIYTQNLELIDRLRRDIPCPLFEFSYIDTPELSRAGVPCWQRWAGSEDRTWEDICSDGWHPGPITHRKIARWLSSQQQLKNL